MRRIVSVFLPTWSTDRLRRETAKSPPEGVLPDGPLATAVPDHGRRVIAAVDAGARALGVTRSMTVTKARTFAPGLQMVDAEPEADAKGLRPLALWAGTRHAPLVAPDPPDGLWLDVTGCAALFSTERALLNDLRRRTSAFGLSLQMAVADNRFGIGNRYEAPRCQRSCCDSPSCSVWCDHPGQRHREHESVGRPMYTMS
ncbi:MAG: DNA polymerase Y family protein [Pseudomonadota bacterium]